MYNILFHPERNEKKAPKKIKKSLETVSNPGSNPRGGVKMTKKKENGIVGNETVGLVYRYWEC